MREKPCPGGQKIATDLGINEKTNAVICYVIAGVLLGIAGCVYISKIRDSHTGNGAVGVHPIS
jgi:ribose/xylose/arabinose/galactoside ABC-type transport system permease subunit